eukprot:TRINITY_DN21116_c0_g3_i1.p1 TRINITY_DN21116_c0_g3~~TRINITY_DN21116_c0_g3_i1.p1  ORF type:complete len:697 (-),score=196.17 TRINITY_DN21116_c0_g3_i1:23-2077(-)
MNIAGNKGPSGFMEKFASSNSVDNSIKILRSLGRFRLKGFHIAGVAPLNDTILVLAIPNPPSGDPKDASVSVDEEEAKMVNNAQNIDIDDWEHPELLIVSMEGDIISSDALPIVGFEKLAPKEFSFVYYGPGSSSFQSLTNEVMDTDFMYFVISPKDVVVAKVRDVDDHIEFYLQKSQFKNALAEAQKFERDLRTHTVRNIQEAYLQHLISTQKFAEAAAICPSLLQGDPDLWHEYIVAFSEKGQIQALAPYIPTENPKLSFYTYGVVLRDYLISDHSAFLNLIKNWPQTVYQVDVVIAAIKDRLSNYGRSEYLLEALAELYTYGKRYSEALDALIDLGREAAFDLITTYGLTEVISDKVLQLLQLSPQKATDLLVKQVEVIPPSVVMSQIKSHPKLQHEYLHTLFKHDERAGAEFHEQQVRLYARFAPDDLETFLRKSNFYILENALQVCSEKKLFPAMVFLLGRMGSTRQALSLLVGEIKDVKKAIQFVEEHKDGELWKELVNMSLRSPDFVAGLLDHIGGGTKFVNPQELIGRIPESMEIPKLKSRLIRIVSDYALEVRLRAGTRRILNSDCVDLLYQLNADQRRAISSGPDDSCDICKNSLENCFDSTIKTQRLERASIQIDQNFHLKTRGLEAKKESAESQLLFFNCGHKFHSSCTQAAAGNNIQCSICSTDSRRSRGR